MPRLTPFQRLALVALPIVAATLFGCKKEYDSPPVRTLPAGSVLTVAQLKALYQGVPLHFDPSGTALNVYAVVTADEQNGNLYKNVYVQDYTGAIALRLLASGGLYQGDSVRIYLPGTVLSPYNGLMQLDSVSVDNNVVKQATDVAITPRTTQISELTAANFGLGGPFQSVVIKLNNVEFVAGDTSQTYANAVTQATMNRSLENCSGASAIVRTSGYANFAGQGVAKGKGSFTGIASWFGTAAQLYIRDINEVQLNGPRCGATPSCLPASSLSEDFSSVVSNSTVALDCWTNTFTQGSVAWRGNVTGGNGSAEARISLGQASTMWLVTPQIIYTPSLHLSFSSAKQGGGSGNLTVWVSTDFTGNATTATWTQVNGATFAGSGDADNTWVSSGSVALSNALPSGYTGNFVVAFKYQGDATNSTTYRVDNVQVN